MSGVAGIIYRIPKGAPLTAAEMDNNLLLLSNAVGDAQANQLAATKVFFSDTKAVTPNDADKLITLWVVKTGVDAGEYIWDVATSAWVRTQRTVLYATSSGGGGAYTITLPATITDYSQIVGLSFIMNANHASVAGGTTIAVNGIAGTKSLTKSGGVALAANDLLAGGAYLLVYDGANVQVLNPSPPVANTITSYSKTFAMPALGAGSTVVQAHGLTILPQMVRSCWLLTGSDGGYVAGNEPDLGTLSLYAVSASQAETYPPVTVEVDATNITVRWTSTAAPVFSGSVLVSSSDSAGFNTAAYTNWALKVYLTAIT